jgi:hypothetical protein
VVEDVALKNGWDGPNNAVGIRVVLSRAGFPKVIGLYVDFARGMYETEEHAGDNRDDVDLVVHMNHISDLTRVKLIRTDCYLIKEEA